MLKTVLSLLTIAIIIRFIISRVLKNFLFNVFLKKRIEHSNQIQVKEWERFYLEVFGIKCDLSNIPLPKWKWGFGWLIAVLTDITMENVITTIRQKFPTECVNYYFDTEIFNHRDSRNGPYICRIRSRKEADRENRNISAEMIEEKKSSITLLERLLLELFYFWKTGKHLDERNATLCAGSYFVGRGVPTVSLYCKDAFEYEHLMVSGCFRGDTCAQIRSRTVILAEK